MDAVLVHALYIVLTGYWSVSLFKSPRRWAIDLVAINGFDMNEKGLG